MVQAYTLFSYTFLVFIYWLSLNPQVSHHTLWLMVSKFLQIQLLWLCLLQPGIFPVQLAEVLQGILTGYSSSFHIHAIRVIFLPHSSYCPTCPSSVYSCLSPLLP